MSCRIIGLSFCSVFHGHWLVWPRAQDLTRFLQRGAHKYPSKCLRQALSFLPTARVEPGVLLGEPGCLDRSVDLSGAYIGMPQHLLDCP